ncbi:Hyaluronan and proteoglycan link protein 3 [Bienertia sinuspersici]
MLQKFGNGSTKMTLKGSYQPISPGKRRKRWKQFCWKLVHNALPTKDNLVKRKIEVNLMCAFCGEKETSDHLFLNSEITKRLGEARADQNQTWLNLVAIALDIWIHKNNIIFRNEKE